MPLIAFILLAIVCLAILGFACACLTDVPTQAIDRALSIGSALPPLIVIWSTFAAFLGAGVLVASQRQRGSRASPALLQRFLI